jgi:hypothetical protein
MQQLWQLQQQQQQEQLATSPLATAELIALLR